MSAYQDHVATKKCAEMKLMATPVTVNQISRYQYLCYSAWSPVMKYDVYKLL